MACADQCEEKLHDAKPVLWKSAQVRVSLLSWLFIFIGLMSSAMDLINSSKVFYIFAIVSGAFFFSREGIEKALKEREIGIDLLMSAAILGASVLGEWREAALVAALFSISEALESFTIQKTRYAIKSLMDLIPPKARVIRNGGEVEVNIESVQIGEKIRVRPGESIPVDGIIEEGITSINEAAVTGESIPVDKMVGNEVFAGTINHNGSIVIKTTKAFEDNTVNKIIDLVEKSQDEKGQAQQFVERFGKIYSPSVLCISVLIACFAIFSDAPRDWVVKAITFLVAASPCALAISAPITVIAAIGSAARKGVLIKGGAILEAMGKTKAIAIDKTGTLTQGRPEVTAIFSPKILEDELIKLAASVEFHSEHPLARAIVSYSEKRQLELLETKNFRSLTSVGATAEVNGKLISVIKPKAAEDFSYSISNEIKSWGAAAQAKGQTVIAVSKDDEVIGMISLSDTVRPEARSLIKDLDDIGIKKIVMLTGDNPGSARSIASYIGILDVYAGLHPEDKVHRVRELKDKHKWVAMVGDGINDAPALAAASVGIAMGTGGSDAALAAADVALIKNDLSRLKYAVKLGARSKNIINQNITLSLIVVGILIIATFSNSISMFHAVVGHEGSELLIILNGLRIAWQRS